MRATQNPRGGSPSHRNVGKQRREEPSAGEREGLAPRRKEQREGLAPRKKEQREGRRLTRETPPRKKESAGGVGEGLALQMAEPCERLLRTGPDSLRDVELLSLLLRPGNGRRSAATLAKDLLKRFGDVAGVLSQDARALGGVTGLGATKVAALVSIRELLKRAERASLDKEKVWSSSTKVRRHITLHLAHYEQEVFGALFLSARHHMLAMEDMFFGSVDRAAVYPREVMKRCLHHNAAAVILYHNHPSGVPDPSQMDRDITARLVAVLTEIDVEVIDHVVVGRMRNVSMADKGML